MKVIGYMGAEGECIVINKTTDIYPLLDWCQSRMMDNQDAEKNEANKAKWGKSIIYLNRLMEQVENDGFGSYDDVDEVEY